MSNKLGELLSPELKDFSPDEIEAMLTDAASEINTGNYTVLLSDSEKEEKRKILMEVLIEIQDLEKRKSDFVTEIKSQLKPLNEDKLDLLATIKHGSEHRHGKLYSYPDYTDNKMYLYDAQGVCVEIRPLRAKERQTNILNINKASNE